MFDLVIRSVHNCAASCRAAVSVFLGDSRSNPKRKVFCGHAGCRFQGQHKNIFRHMRQKHPGLPIKFQSTPIIEEAPKPRSPEDPTEKGNVKMMMMMMMKKRHLKGENAYKNDGTTSIVLILTLCCQLNGMCLMLKK